MSRKFTDRERILTNIAAFLASEVAYLQNIPAVRERIANPNSLSRVRVDDAWTLPKDFKKGDLVGCRTSIGRQQNEWLISFVEGPHPSDDSGLCLRSVGTDKLTNYGNESFMRITGIPEQFLWEGDKHQFSRKLQKAIRKLGSYGHRFRGLEFPEEGVAHIYIGEVFGGFGEKKTKPYLIAMDFGKRTTVKQITEELKAQGFGTRAFEPDDGTYSGPMQGLASFTRESLVQVLEAEGIKLKDR